MDDVKNLILIKDYLRSLVSKKFSYDEPHT